MDPQDLKTKNIEAGDSCLEDSVAGTTDDIIYYILSISVTKYCDGKSFHKSLVLGYYFDDRSKARKLARSLAGGPVARSVKGLDDWYESEPEMIDGVEHYNIFQVHQLKAWRDGMWRWFL